jgi:riboflavin synthase alpha subunit
VGEVLSVRRAGIAWEVRISLPGELRGAVAAKGSIAIDGISLTVMRVEGEAFEVGIIPHTLKETTIRAVKAGMRVNLEADVLARYVLQSLQALAGGSGAGGGLLGGAAQGAGSGGGSGGGLTEEFLRERGFA